MKILVADDSKAMRMIVVRTLRQAGIRKVLQGMAPIEDVLGATMADEEDMSPKKVQAPHAAEKPAEKAADKPVEKPAEKVAEGVAG